MKLLLAGAACAVLVLQASAQTPSQNKIAEGRALLEAGEAEQALAVFEEVLATWGDSPDKRLWILRSWIALGRIDEALHASDELGAQGANAGELAYLRGLGFHAKAMRDVRESGGGSFTIGELQDATSQLEVAVQADPARFYDALIPLAESAWNVQRLELASSAVEQALARNGADVEALRLRGRIAFSQFVALRNEAGDPSESEQAWERAKASFELALEGLGQPLAADQQYAVAESLVQIAHLYEWKEDAERAKETLAVAMAWDPRAVDLNRLLQSLEPEVFIELMRSARTDYAKLHAREDPSAALLAWWHAFALFGEGRHSEAEPAFRLALDLQPSFVNTWYYIHRTAYGQQAFEESVNALRAYWQAAPEDLVRALQGDKTLNLAILDFLTGWCNDEKKHGEIRFADAALISEIATGVAPDEARYWNNLGLFRRDLATHQLTDGELDAEEILALYESAYEAYQRTLELEPENPAYLNDTALMLHYYLMRDLDRALAMYERAAVLADELLARPDLSYTDRPWIEAAKSDCAENLARLRDELEHGQASEESPR